MAVQCEQCQSPVSPGAKTCSHCGARVELEPEVADALAGLLLLAGTAFIASKIVRWVSRRIDWEQVGRLVSELLEEVADTDDIVELRRRVELARTIFNTGERYTPEMAIALGGGALEAFLKSLGEPSTADDTTARGLGELAVYQYEQGLLSSSDLQQITWITDLRNPAVHGDLLKNPEEVGRALDWIGERLNQNR